MPPWRSVEFNQCQLLLAPSCTHLLHTWRPVLSRPACVAVCSPWSDGLLIGLPLGSIAGLLGHARTQCVWPACMLALYCVCGVCLLLLVCVVTLAGSARLPIQPPSSSPAPFSRPRVLVLLATRAAISVRACLLPLLLVCLPVCSGHCMHAALFVACLALLRVHANCLLAWSTLSSAVGHTLPVGIRTAHMQGPAVRMANC